MLIDWFTVGAQIINFLVLVWLLKRFLYKPILTAMEDRERTIAANLESAVATKAEAEQARLIFTQNMQELEGHKLELLKQATLAADKEYQDLMEEKRKEVQARQLEWYKALEAEQGMFLAELESKARTELLDVSRQVLTDLAGVDLEDRMALIFIQQVKDSFQDESSGVATVLGKGQDSAVIRSASALSDQSRQAILSALRQAAGSGVSVVFETSPQLVAGIELVAGGQKVSWSIDKYLLSLRKSMEQILERKQNHGS